MIYRAILEIEVIKVYYIKEKRDDMQLATKRLELVPLEVKYAKELLELWQDEEVIRYTNALQLEDVDAVRDKITRWLQREEQNEYISHFVILKDKEVIGVIGIPTINAEQGKNGFYYQLIKRFWHNGYGEEAAKAVFEYAIKEVKVSILLADAVTANSASIKILKGLGFEETGITRHGFTESGKLHDVIHFQYVSSLNV